LARSLSGALGDVGSFGGANDDFDTYTGMGEHVDKSVDAEQVNLSIVEIADAGLRHTEQLGSFGLFETLRFDGLAEVNH